MYQLFEDTLDPIASVTRPPGFNYVRRIYSREIATITNYYDSRTFYLHNTHILVRLLNSFPTPIDIPSDRYIEIALTRGPYLAKYFKMTSEIELGHMFNGVFYGPGVNEIIIASESKLSPFISKNWKKWKPVTVLDHPVSDMGLLIPNGGDNSTASGIAVIAIDVPLLLMQYRMFLIEQYKLNQTNLTSNHFLYKHVLPGMLDTHIDIVILNRLMNLYYGAPHSEALKKYKFPILDISPYIDKNLDHTLHALTNARKPYYGYLQHIPGITNESLDVSCKMPDLAKTRQVWWAMYATRLKLMLFLLDIGGMDGMRSNGSYIAKARIDTSRLHSEHIYDRLPGDVYSLFLEFKNKLNLK
jgi:hypothetical protein